MRVDAVAIDIDGTITDARGRLGPAAIVALNKAAAAGVVTIPATANVLPVTKTVADLCAMSGPLVCENGGVVYSADLLQRDLLRSRQLADRAIEQLQLDGLQPVGLWSNRYHESEVVLQLGPDPVQIRHSLSHLAVEVVDSRFGIHIRAAGVDKATGLHRALAMLEPTIDVRHVLAIGDGKNDVPLFAAAGAAAAVANASSAVQEAADYVASASHGDGLAEALEHFGVV